MYESWVYSVYNFALGLPIIFYGIFDRDIPQTFALKYPQVTYYQRRQYVLSNYGFQVYRTGLTNTHLNIRTVKTWIVNAVFYAVVFCLVWFNVVAPSFTTYSLYEMGTTIYVGLVLALQFKVAFIHHLWNQIHFWSMFISVGGLFLFLYVLNSMEENNYNFYFVANKIYGQNLFWFFGVFSTPIICVLIDFIGHSFYVVLAPTDEMLYREAAMLSDEANEFKEKGGKDKQRLGEDA
jgi:magnesium-transporting ATPase (P-type)